jgi:non-ribosomal peptide synthetase component F
MGELYIAGDGVGSYVDKQLNDRMYVDNPFRHSPHLFGRTSQRMFRVGDVLRYRDRGDEDQDKQNEEEKDASKDTVIMQIELEFLGRVDHQVKIRGYRIELEEIVN